MMDPTYPLFPIFTFLSFVLVLIPLPWHLQAWNVGTCAYMIWTAIACLNQFVNAVVWRNDAINYAPVWCDISSRIIIATSVAIPAASLTITRRLYQISRVQTVMSSAKEKRREMAIDLSLVIGLPVLVMILYYFVQGHRFNIFEQVGCFPVTFNTPPAYPLVWMWPLFLGVISMVYCSLTVWAFLKRRREMNQFLTSNSQITMSRYFRLMALALMDTCLTVPLASFSIWLNAVESQISPWRGLADAHWGFHRVEQIPAVMWRLSKWNTLSFYLDRWFIVFCALVFFAFFGFAEESRKNYARVYWNLAKRFGYYPPARGLSVSGGSSAYRTPALPRMSTIGGHGHGGLRVLVSSDAKVEKRDSFLSSIGDLSSSFTVDDTFDERKTSPTESFSSDSLPVTPTAELSGVPHLHSDAQPQPQPQSGLTVPPPTRPARPNSLDMV